MTPNGNIYLCANTNLCLRGSDYDTIYFPSEADKRTWFTGKTVKTLTAQMYTRVGDNTAGSTLGGEQYSIIGRNIIKVGLPYGEINACDYLYFINTGYENKYYYCFITDIKYINDNVTQIEFVEDVFMTWCHQMSTTNGNLGYSFVVRESTSTDNYWEDRNEVEDYGINATYHSYYKYDIDASHTKADTYMCVCTNDLISTDGEVQEKIVTSGGQELTFRNLNDFSMNCGKPDNLLYYIAKMSDVTACANLSQLVRNANQENIMSVFPVPLICIPAEAELQLTSNPSRIVILCGRSIPEGSRPKTTSATEYYTMNYASSARTRLVSDGTHLSMYNLVANVFRQTAMRNRKLYNSPYCLIRLTNNYGGTIDLHPELIHGVEGQNVTPASKLLEFTIKGSLYLSPKVQLTIAYDGRIDNPLYKIDLVPQPSLPVTSDVAKEWHRQNDLGQCINFTMGMAKLGVGIAAATSSGGLIGGGMALSGLSDVGNFAGTMWKVAHLPMSTTGGTDAGVSARSFELDKFSVEFLSIDKEVAIDIDNYFTKYGYAVQCLKNVPFGLNGRSYFYYVQTDNLTVKGNIPQYAKANIKRLYDKGIRLWSASHFLDYSAGNSLST